MFIPRKITKKFETLSKINSITIIVGPRQSGKTTFLKQEAEKNKAVYLFFDDPDVKEIFDKDIKRFENQYLYNNKITVLDEIQYTKDPGKNLKYLADSGKRLWVTSSSEILLNKNVISWLVGRASIIKLYPFSLEEFLIAKNYKELTETMLERAIYEHIQYGGYPKIVIEQDILNKESLLKNLYETMILKDIAFIFDINNISNLEKFAIYLSHYVGNLVQYNNICRDIEISFQTLQKYFNAFEKSYIVTLIKPFYKNKISEITKQPKLYFIDTGLRNAISNEFKLYAENKGKMFENYVFTELLKLGLTIRYWRSKNNQEIDFVVEKNNKQIPIEVKFKINDNAVIERSMKTFIEIYKPEIAFVVFLEGKEDAKKLNNCIVKFTDIRKLETYLESL